jgi:hypothetical protein
MVKTKRRILYFLNLKIKNKNFEISNPSSTSLESSQLYSGIVQTSFYFIRPSLLNQTFFTHEMFNMKYTAFQLNTDTWHLTNQTLSFATLTEQTNEPKQVFFAVAMYQTQTCIRPPRRTCREIAPWCREVLVTGTAGMAMRAQLIDRQLGTCTS